jgi:hypothetical protein
VASVQVWILAGVVPCAMHVAVARTLLCACLLRVRGLHMHATWLECNLLSTCNFCSGHHVQLLWAVLCSKGASGERVRQLLYKSPDLERRLMSVVETWLDALDGSDLVSPRLLVGMQLTFLSHDCFGSSLAPAWHLPDWCLLGTFGTLARHLGGTCFESCTCLGVIALSQTNTAMFASLHAWKQVNGVLYAASCRMLTV